MTIGIYIDDATVLQKNITDIEDLMLNIQREFKIKIINKPSVFLGMEITLLEECLELNQPRTISCLLEDYKMFDDKPVSTPAAAADDKENKSVPIQRIAGKSSIYFKQNTTRYMLWS